MCPILWLLDRGRGTSGHIDDPISHLGVEVSQVLSCNQEGLETLGFRHCRTTGERRRRGGGGGEREGGRTEVRRRGGIEGMKKLGKSHQTSCGKGSQPTQTLVL